MAICTAENAESAEAIPGRDDFCPKIKIEMYRELCITAKATKNTKGTKKFESAEISSLRNLQA
jgi:hypothetical protein